MTMKLAEYRNIGLTLTPQRIAILEFLEGNCSHPSAEDIYRAVSSRFPTMSLATVYNTLAALKAKGNILELSLDAGKKRYDPNTSDHNHIICITCRRIIDIPSESTLYAAGSVLKDFNVLKSTVEIQGICPDCIRLK